MKKFILMLSALLVMISLTGCENNSTQYTENDFIGVWITEENIEKLRQMSDFEKSFAQVNIKSMRICESNSVIYTPTSTDAHRLEASYSFNGDSIVVQSTYRNFGEYSSGKKTYDIIKTDNGYELEADGKRYIKICNDLYVYDMASFSE